MHFCAPISPLLSRRNFGRAALAFFCASFLSVNAPTARAYVLEGKSWPSGTTIVIQLALGDAGRTLTDGNTNYNTAAAPSADVWNQVMGRVQLSESLNSTAALSSGDRVNTAAFAPTVFGTSFGTGTLAVTYYIMQGSNMLEADVLFNSSVSFDSYRGPLRFGSNGYAVADIRRVFLHELGHALGLNHQQGDDIMNATISDREALAPDDVAGIQYLYGAPAAPTPTPVPTPVPTPTPAPTAAPAPSISTLVNISTRMNVGINDNVLIGGFILKGTAPKKLLLRAIGPSLAQYGVTGVLQDPVIELHDGTGALLMQDDNWQTGGQTTEIIASGKAPSDAREAALIAKLPPGNYTAIVHGANNTQGVALIEGYELDTPATRLANISTRGNIGSGDNVMIAGFIVQGAATKNLIIRATGPSLAQFLNGWISDPSLELYDGNGTQISTNDNWHSSSQVTQIQSSGYAPSAAAESAIIAALPPGNYTAIVRGVNGVTGIGMVEVYDLD